MPASFVKYFYLVIFIPTFLCAQENISNNALPDIRDAYGVSIADFNGDGLLDIYIVGFRTLNRMLINRGDRTFIDKSIAAGVGGNLMPKGIKNLEVGAATADFDNDGAIDILITGWGDGLDLLKNRKDGTFYSVTSQMGLAQDIDANMGVWADLDQDGYVDLLLTNEHGPIQIYHNDHGLKFNQIPLAQTGLPLDSGSQGAAFTDLDLDGDLDLVVAGWKKPLQIFEQISPFYFKQIPLNIKFKPGMRCNAILVGDVDNDGDFDLVVTVREGHNLLLINQNNPSLKTLDISTWKSRVDSIVKPLHFVEQAHAWGIIDSADHYGGALADFDGDGDFDLLLTTRGANFYYENSEHHFYYRNNFDLGLPPNFSTYNTGFVPAPVFGGKSLDWLMASRDSACQIQAGLTPKLPRIEVKLHAVESNVSSIGAQITFWSRKFGDPGEWQLQQFQEVSGGYGYFSSYIGPLLFTLPDTLREYQFAVRFPNGKRVEYKINPHDSIIDIWESRFFPGTWAKIWHWSYTTYHDPVRRKNVLFAVAAFILLTLLSRTVLRIMATSIARRQNQAELVQKNEELRLLIEEVQKTQQQLIHSEKLAGLGQLVAGIAHELNNPIGFIYANLHQIQKYLDRSDFSNLDEKSKLLVQKMKEALAECQDGSIRIRDIVQNLRGLSRAGNADESKSLTKKVSDLNLMIDKSALLAQTNFSKNIQLQKQYAELPPISIDETQIQQVILNILVNAGQALDKEGSIFIHTFEEGPWAVVSIKDNGLGIKPDHLHRIFEPFFTTKPVGQGIGLGLHLSYQIIKAHEGYITVNSVMGHGAEFIIKLPLDKN